MLDEGFVDHDCPLHLSIVRIPRDMRCSQIDTIQKANVDGWLVLPNVEHERSEIAR